jgi:hypothetical protein
MSHDLLSYPWVLDTQTYQDKNELRVAFPHITQRAKKRALELRIT